MSEQSTLTTGPMQGRNTIGEVTEALHRFLLDGWKSEGPKPRIEEDLSFVPKDREEVVYVYMYKTTQNTSLINSKRRRMAKFTAEENAQGILDPKEVYWERPPLYLELHYLIAVHSKFRSDAERLLGCFCGFTKRLTCCTVPASTYCQMGRPWIPRATNGVQRTRETR
jgi:hypothetical protein